MKNKIRLNNEITMDIPDLIQSGMVILANSGGGKSYAIRKIAEEAVGQIQTIILDPEGEFASLRENFDFILAGKNADVPVEVRSAELLTTRLLELGKSAIIDLYELHPQERQRFVKIFCDTVVNCPKELYHPVLIILDEAHEYAPEGKPSEATWSVELLASKGRKRGQRLILASQRVAKLSKNITAESNNKLIGRASQDIDMKRAGDELGFNKESMVQLRQLKPGEFFAFGPAISTEVVKLKIGDVKTSHAKVTYYGKNKVPPPSNIIKKVLAEIKDLPEEAKKEAKTVAELKAEIKQLKTKVTQLPQKIVENDPKVIEKALSKRDEEWNEALKASFMVHEKGLLVQIRSAQEIMIGLEKLIQGQFKGKISPVIIKKYGGDPAPFRYNKVHIDNVIPGSPILTKNGIDRAEKTMKEQYPAADMTFARKTDYVDMDGKEIKPLGLCSRMIASYLYNLTDGNLKTKTQVAVATGYSQNSGGFNNSISELSSIGLITRTNGILSRNHQILAPELMVNVDTSLSKWSSKLGACARKIWELLLEDQSHDARGEWPKEDIATETGYSVTSGGFNNSLSELSALGLIERMSGGIIRINPEVLNL